MLTPEDRHELRTSRIARFYEMARQFEVVTDLYPAQRLALNVDVFAIKEIMNCTGEEAGQLLREIGKIVSNEFVTSVRTSEFCDYMNVDEMLIQVFLASINFLDESLPPTDRLPALTIEQINTQRPRKVCDLVEKLRDGILENTKTYALRAKLYDEANPYGEPMYKRFKFVQMVIRAFEVAQIYGCHIDTAQAMLREVREKDREQFGDSKVRRHVSIKRFCAVHNEDEEDLRKHLAILHGPDDDDDEDDDN